jgi:seryl-tRNA synthetase
LQHAQSQLKEAQETQPRAIAREKQARKEAEQQSTNLQAKLKQLQHKSRSQEKEMERLTKRLQKVAAESLELTTFSLKAP